MIEEFDLEKEELGFMERMLKGLKIAKANRMNLSKFKVEIKKGLLSTNDEDQWTFDYQSYLSDISNGIYTSPSEWAIDYFRGRWNKQ